MAIWDASLGMSNGISGIFEIRSRRPSMLLCSRSGRAVRQGCQQRAARQGAICAAAHQVGQNPFHAKQVAELRPDVGQVCVRDILHTAARAGLAVCQVEQAANVVERKARVRRMKASRSISPAGRADIHPTFEAAWPAIRFVRSSGSFRRLRPIGSNGGRSQKSPRPSWFHAPVLPRRLRL